MLWKSGSEIIILVLKRKDAIFEKEVCTLKEMWGQLKEISIVMSKGKVTCHALLDCLQFGGLIDIWKLIIF